MRIVLYISALFLFIHTKGFSQSSLSKADSLFEAGDFNRALDEATKCESKLTDNALLVDCKNLIANTLIRLGRPEEAIEKVNEAQEINSSQLNNSKSEECLNTEGYVYLIQGKNENALEKFQMAEKVGQSSGQPTKSLTYNNLALVYWNTGNRDLAMEYHLKALQLRKSQGDQAKAEVAASLNNIGLLYSESSPETALDYYTQALEIYKEQYGEDHPKIAIAYNNIAIIYRGQGKITEALDMFDKVLAIWQHNFGEDHPNVAFTYSNIGQMYMTAETKEIAFSYFNKALSIYESSYGKKHPEVANTYNFIGNVYRRSRDYQNAITNYQLALIANIPSFNDKDNNTLPPIEGSFNQYTLLTTLLYKAQALEELHLNKTLKFKDLEASLKHLELCDKLIENIRHTTVNESDKIALGNISSEVYEDAVRVSVQLAGTSLKWKYYQKKAFYFSEKNKSAVLLEAISESDAKHFANIPEELLEKESKLSSDIAYYEQKLAQGVSDEKEKTRITEKLFELHQSYKSFTTMLETSYPDYYNLKYNVDVTTVDELQNNLDSATAVISYFQAPNTGRLYVFYITKNKFKIYDIKRLDELDKNLTGMRNALEYNIFKIFSRESYEVYQQIMPFKITSKTKKLIIIPDGRLGTIPFESLTTEKAGSDIIDFGQLEYLIKKVSVSYDYSATLYLQAKKKSDERTDDPSIFLCAPVEFNSTLGPLSSLPGTQKEVEEIMRIFDAKGLVSSSYLHNAAQETLIKSNNLKKYKFLHFATHGIVNEKKPELSEIFLNPDVNTNEDGNLFCAEIYNLDLDADLVCVSACETGLGKYSKGEGIIGLTRALIYAGSNNLVVSLWKVADESTSQLMVKFYYNLLQEKHPYSESLRHAKLDLINSVKFSSPFYWAPFILIGK